MQRSHEPIAATWVDETPQRSLSFSRKLLVGCDLRHGQAELELPLEHVGENAALLIAKKAVILTKRTFTLKDARINSR